MTTEQKKRLFELFTAHAADALTPDEHAELQETLRLSAEARRLWFVHQDVEMGLHAHLSAEPVVANKTSAKPTWFAWHPFTAAAAGIAFGMFCTSVVFAYAVPRMRMDRQRVVPIFQETFEEVKAAFGRGFPNDAGVWSGDFAAVVPTEGDVSPKEGLHMARLAPRADRKGCAAARIVDLAEFPAISGMQSRMVEVTASFHGIDTEWADRNQIRLAAFSEAPQEVKAIWNGDSRLERALQHLGRTVTMKPGEHGWQTLKVWMEIPPGARSLVIHLGAEVADDTGPKTLHYLDDVRAQFVITESTP